MKPHQSDAIPKPAQKTVHKTVHKLEKRSFLATLAAVFWSFAGLRRRSDYEKDATSLNPFYVIGAGLIAVAIFIAVLLMVVRMVVSG